jgi:hypothetical protein
MNHFQIRIQIKHPPQPGNDLGHGCVIRNIGQS